MFCIMYTRNGYGGSVKSSQKHDKTSLSSLAILLLGEMCSRLTVPDRVPRSEKSLATNV